jgi:dolichol-phosphate mannosyltransferase
VVAHATQFGRFAVVGTSGLIVNLGVYSILLHATGATSLVAAAGSFVVAAASNYIWNRAWTFDRRCRTLMRGARFLCVSVGSFGVGAATLVILERLGVAPEAAQAFGVLLAAPLSFVAHRRWTFAPDRRGGTGGHAPQ